MGTWHSLNLRRAELNGPSELELIELGEADLNEASCGYDGVPRWKELLTLRV